MSRQTLWKQRKLAAGLCIHCGKRPINPKSVSRCTHCATKARTKMRRKLGFKAGSPRITRTAAIDLLLAS